VCQQTRARTVLVTARRIAVKIGKLFGGGALVPTSRPAVEREPPCFDFVASVATENFERHLDRCRWQ